MRRLSIAQAFVAFVAIVGVPIGFAGVSVAAPGAPSPATSVIGEGVDFTSESYADRLDFSNVEDFNPTPMTMSESQFPGLGSSFAGEGLHNATENNGTADMTAEPGSYFEVSRYWGGALHLGHDGATHPIDTARYTRFQVRMFSSSSGLAALFWFNCHVNQGNCQGVQLIPTTAGWNTYDVAIANTAGNLAWSGMMEALRFYPNFAAGGSPAFHIAFDWMRVAAPGSNVNVTIPQAAQQVFWDNDTNPANNNPAALGAPGSAVFATNIGAGGNAIFPAGGLSPGVYYLAYVSGGVTSDYSAPLTVLARPEPVILDPSVVGGDDYATTVRGDAWDFSQAADVQGCESCLINVSGGFANGTPIAPNQNNTGIFLPLAGFIDPNIYHRLSVKVSYNGTMGLADAPGGGMVARLLWAVPNGTGGENWTETNDMVVSPTGSNGGIYPGGIPLSQTLSVDLKTNPVFAINDENSLFKAGWGGPSSQQISNVRFDPHEDPDPAGRNWSVDYVTIARNSQGKPHFNIKFQDNAWSAGTTADLYADSDGSGFNGTKIASGIGVANGVNSFDWNGTDFNGNPLGAGTYFIHVRMTNTLAVAAQAYAAGELEMPTQPANPPSAPLTPNAVAGLESASVSWTPPLGNGGAPIANYVVTVNPGGGTIPISFGTNTTTVTGLTGGTSYTFAITAQNSAGTSVSVTTNAVVPSARGGTRFKPVVPYRVLDSRGPTGGWNDAQLGAGQSRDLVVAGTGGITGVPATASAVVMNLTATGGTAPSFVTVYPSGSARPNPSNLNFGAGQTIPNLVTAKIGSNDSVALFNANGSVDFVADVVGYFDDGLSSNGDLFNGITPVRVLDSRGVTGGWRGPIGAGAPNQKNLVVAGGATGVPLTATAVVMNVTTTDSNAGSFLSVWPTGASQPISSNLNFGPGQTIANLVVVQIGAGQSVSFFNAVGSTNVIADVLAYFDPTVGGSFFHAMAPVRILDDRFNVGGYNSPWPATPPTPARTVILAGANGVPAGATGVVMNTTVTGGTNGSFLKVYPAGVPAPITSNVNFGPGQTIPNLVMAQLPPSGMLAISNLLGTVDVIGDASGYYALT